MCGICGFNWNDKILLNRMISLMKNRGPNDKGTLTDSNLSLGHTRLSIIDLSKKGHQPMFNEDGTVAVIFNGEIYNYKELRRELKGKHHKFTSESDTEVIVHLYEEEGVGLVKRLQGIFAICIYDLTKKELLLTRDHLGVKPLYYYFDNDKFLFASDIKPLFEYIKPELNKNSFSNYLTFRYVPSPETLFKNIMKVPPANVLTFDLKNNSLNISEYWDLDMNNTSREPEHILAKKLNIMLSETVNKQLMSDVPLGVYLSGGIDSSCVVAMMNRLGYDNIETFSIGFENYNDSKKELNHAFEVSEHFGTNHHELMLSANCLESLPQIMWHMEDLVSDATMVPTYFLSEFAKEKVTVTLTGEGGDEAFGGYVHYPILRKKMLYDKIVPEMVSKGIISPIINTLPVKLIDNFFNYPSSIGVEGKKRIKEFLNSKDKVGNYISFISLFSKEDKQSLLADKSMATIKIQDFKGKNNFLDQLAYRENKTWLPDYILNRLDKMTMAHSIESRVPFLDHKLVEFISTIPRQYKNNKNILRLSMKGLVPKQILKRKKTPFIMPIDAWYNKGYKKFAKQILSEKNMNEFPFLNKKYVEKLLSKNNSSIIHSRQLWSLMSFTMWHKLFIEGMYKKKNLKIDNFM